jgi:aspartate racemase
MDNIVQPAIDLIKAGNIDEAHDMLLKVVDQLIPWNVDAVVLGCTEIPLAIKETHHRNIPLINIIDSLVKVIIKEYNK